MHEYHPLFLVIDDAHWADEASLSTLAYILVRPPFTDSASMALIARTEDISSSLQKMLDSIQQSKHATIYTLQNLNREAIENLASQILKDQPSDQFISNLIADTGGNTFFVLEILRAISEAGLDIQDLDINLPSTENLQNLILTRIHTIQPKSREVIEVAALLGSDFSIKVLEKASQKSAQGISKIIVELEEKLMILPSDQDRGEVYYHFAHDKIRETLVQRIPPARSQLLHKQIVEALSQTQSQAAVLAHHYSGAGDLVSAYRYWIKAAEQARLLFAKEDAMRNYAQAETVLHQIDTELSDLEIYRFYDDWNDLTYNVSDTGLLQHIGYELIRLGEDRDNHLLIGTGLDALGDACMTINDFEAGLAYANQAIYHLEQEEHCFELVEAYNHRGTFLYMLNRLEEALVSFQDALALSTDLNDPKIDKALSNAHYQTALLKILFGKPVAGLEHGLKALEYGEKLQHTYSIVQAYSIQALAQFYMGDFPQALEAALAGINLAERTQGLRMLGYLNSYAAMTETALGYLDTAYEHAEKAVEIGQTYEQLDIAALGYHSLGDIHRLLFDYAQAADYYQQGFTGIPESFIGLDNLHRLGLAQHYLGNSGGMDQINTSLAIMNEASVFIGALTAKICSALVFANQEDWQNMQNIATELFDETHNRGLSSFHISMNILLAQANITNGDFLSALDQIQFAANEARFLRNPWLEIKAQSELEKILRLQGKKTDKPGKRINCLLSQIETHISHPVIQNAFRNFKQQIADRTWIATDTL
jgi:tetratricopeptide (TPR) repeat protein